MNDYDYEYNYVVYEPTSNGNGIVLGVFVDVEQAAIFIKGYYGAYENETSLAVKKVPVTDDNHIQRYIQRRRMGTDDDMIPKMTNPTFVELE